EEGSWVVGRGSWVVGRRSWIVGRGSWGVSRSRMRNSIVSVHDSRPTIRGSLGSFFPQRIRRASCDYTSYFPQITRCPVGFVFPGERRRTIRGGSGRWVRFSRRGPGLTRGPLGSFFPPGGRREDSAPATPTKLGSFRATRHAPRSFSGS